MDTTPSLVNNIENVAKYIGLADSEKREVKSSGYMHLPIEPSKTIKPFAN